MKDQEIIELFFERSEQAIENLAVRYGAAVRSTASHILKDQQDVEECVNDTYLHIWNSIPPRRPERLGAFACRVARNTALSRHHFNFALRRNGHFDAALDELADCLAAVETVESDYDARELAEAINRFLGGLSEKDRRLFIERYWLGAGVSQVADSVGLTAHAVSVRLFRIRSKLIKYLRKEGIIQ